jgi:hypothetical protein
MFAGFLNGLQQSRVWGYLAGIPVVCGKANAVVRVRRDRRLVTWGERPMPSVALYMPRQLVPPDLWTGMSEHVDLVDTGSEADGFPPLTEEVSHPQALIERAVDGVRAVRERREQTLAETWCATERSPLYIDGGIGRNATLAQSTVAIGVVKRHGTLYVTSGELAVVARLAPGERTTAFRLAPANRRPVLSWYLRMREAGGHDPFWGLVRVEIAGEHEGAVTARADEVSRWVLAETAPVALPDARWHAMTYGIRNCEEFLRATL